MSRLALCVLLLAACTDSSLGSRAVRNRGAYIPAACFARIDGARGAHNPCYVCHAQGRAPNHVDERELQLRYDFPQLVAGRQIQNPWLNAWKDRRPEIARISDAEVQAYVARSNYARQGVNLLARALERLPSHWDENGNGRWDGYTPDAAFTFDAEGWDAAADGGKSGWRAFRYAPLPGAFMPTNGSFDDVAIRLPVTFRADASGNVRAEVYAINLAVVEALIKREDVAIEPADERALGVDLDRDGQLGLARLVRFAWRSGQPDSMQYVGAAGRLRREGRVGLAPGLYPQGTEFLHSVRYLSVDSAGGVRPAPRMKELRYARKHTYLTYAELADRAQREDKEATLNPDRPEQFAGDTERGLSNALGWTYQGFIEDARGELRPQSHEETLACMGCHGGLAVTTDASFAFARKLSDGPAHGYGDSASTYTGHGFGDTRGEYARYLQLNATGDAFGANTEVRARFFTAAGAPRSEAFARLALDASSLLVPSRERALALNKAYWSIVREQSFVHGRDAHVEPVDLAWREVQSGQATGIRAPLERSAALAAR